jgi:hypothetical protein
MNREPRSEAGGTEPGFATRCGHDGVGFFEDRFNALDDAELGDAMAEFDRLRCGIQVGQDNFYFAAIAAVDDAGERGDAAQSEAGTVLDERAVGRGKLHGKAGAHGLGSARLANGGQRKCFAGEEVGGEVAEWAGVGVARELCRFEKPLDKNLR